MQAQGRKALVGRELRVRSVEVGGSADNGRSLEMRLGGRGQLEGHRTVLVVTSLKHCILFFFSFKMSLLQSMPLGSSVTEFTVQVG